MSGSILFAVKQDNVKWRKLVDMFLFHKHSLNEYV